MDSRLEEKLQQARQNLLDLTMRNRLLNYRPTKARSLRLLDVEPRAVFDVLINQGKVVLITGRSDLETAASDKPAVDKPSTAIEASVSPGSIVDSRLLERLPARLPVFDKAAIPSGNLRASISVDEERLNKRMRDLDSDAQAFVEERGYNVLYLAIGFLEWREADGALQCHEAPLVMIPVKLNSQRQGRPCEVSWNGDDVMANASLRAKLKEQEIEIPELDSPETVVDLDQYYKEVQKSVPSGWVINDRVELDFFSFAGFSLYRDLDPEFWPDTQDSDRTRLLSSILLGESLPGTEGPGFDPEAIDDKLRTADMLHVVDADPSQIAVIEDAKSGRSLVVEGPPGTGKSQTIVNIIAELLACGKKVLFVSQKMAALDVVKQRLDRVGLGTACLELHSDKATKEHFIEQLRKVIESEVSARDPDESDFDRLDILRAQLGAYAKALGAPIGAAGKSPFVLFGLKENAIRHLRPSSASIESLEFEGAERWDGKTISSKKQTVENLARHLAAVGPVTQNPWNGCKVDAVMPNDVPRIRQMLETALKVVKEVKVAAEGVQEIGIPAAGTILQLTSALDMAPEVAEFPMLELTVAMSSSWQADAAAADELLSTVRRVQTLPEANTFKSKYGLSAADVGRTMEAYWQLCETHGFYESLLQRVGRWWSHDYKQIHAQVADWLVLERRTSDRQTLELLASLRDFLKDREWIVARDELGSALFGSAWRGENSDLGQLEAIASRMAKLWTAINQGKLTRDALKAMTRPLADRLEIIRSTREACYRAESILQGVFVRLGRDEAETSVGDAPFGELNRLLNNWMNNIDLLVSWSQYVVALIDCQKNLGVGFVRAAESGLLQPGELTYYFDVCLADTLLREAFNERSSLARFSGTSHEAAIEEYARLDRHIIEANRHRLAALIEGQRPPIVSNYLDGSEAGIVRGEINRKRRHRPIRTLMREAGNYIQSLKPCFLMSPLSVAQFLDPLCTSFDCIIFDEASQVKPEEALGVLLRGKQLIVMGDTKQLPPTSFFDRMASGDPSDDEGDDSVPIQDIESVLHLCKNALPPQCQKSLLWHYRSKHESLIAVSNREFYDNRLRVYPSAAYEDETLGLSFVYLEDTVYDRGRSRTNRLEAREVARRVVRHYGEHPELSLGVGTFSAEQQRAVEDELVTLRDENPWLEQFFDRSNPEHCFVKNIETIQGDERDVIFVSVGYGFDDTRRFSSNFGPINQLGGERRLNVLMTRARMKCVLFANFHPDMIAVDSGTSRGLSALKAFLQYAVDGTYPETSGTGEDAESAFEEAVGETLEEAGFNIRRQVGCAHFRIDIGVVDQARPGRYLCGVECDGASYHSARVARDRDRLRQQILEAMGWRIIRVWSTDWFRDRNRVQARLLDQVRQLAGANQNQSEAYGSAGTSTVRVSTSSGQGRATQVESHQIGAAGQPVAMRPRSVRDVEGAPYRMCTSLYGGPATVGLLEASIVEVASSVVQVVLTEGPIHEDEVVRRIRTLWGLQRSGARVLEKIQRAISYAASWGSAGVVSAKHGSMQASLLDTFLDSPIVRKGKFLWPTSMKAVSARRRDDPALAETRLICDEEIISAIALVLEADRSAPVNEVAIGCAHVLGIQAVHAGTRQRIENVIQNALRDNKLCKLPNGNIALPYT